ncbi:MAG: peptidoglycan-binding protein [Alphaproteobacteria bacterium]
MKPIFPAFPAVAAVFAALVASVWLAAIAPPVLAADFDKGARAYAAGDFAGAAEEWRPLAEAGDMTAQFNLAVLRDNSQSGLFDSASAASWYKRAAAQGFGAAQFNLAVAYQNGRGVPRDMVESLFWLLVAAHAEDQAIGSRASEAAGQLAALLTEQENLQATRRAEQWHAAPETLAANNDKPEIKPYMTLSEADVMTIQRRLKALGYDPGPLDGVAGPATQRAIAAYFKDRDVPWRQGPLSHHLLEMLD